MKKRILPILLSGIMLASSMIVSAEESKDIDSGTVESSQDDSEKIPESSQDDSEKTPESSQDDSEKAPEVDEKTEDNKADIQNEQGEVTEPITKEDKPYLSLGANLSEEQRDKVLSLLGINPAELSEYDVIYTTIEEEYQYLGEYLSAETMGKRSLSSVLVVKREQGHGINITTKNISYCTIGMYKNALITAGITDADIIVAGPFPISGTAALVGAMKAYAVMTGEEVSQESMDAAVNELVVTGELADTLGDTKQVEEFIAYLKQKIVEEGLDSEEEIQKAIKEASKEFHISLSDKDMEKINQLLQKISDLDLNLDSLMSQARDLYDRLADIGKSSGFFEKIAEFFRSIWETILSWFQ